MPPRFVHRLAGGLLGGGVGRPAPNGAGSPAPNESMAIEAFI